MSAPDRIWAMPSDDGWMAPYCGNSPHDGSTEYVRADLCDLRGQREEMKHLAAQKDERVRALEAENARLREWLDGIRQYGSDTLAGPSRDPSGSAFVPDDRSWHREGVLKMTRRASAALNGEPPDWSAALRALEQGNP